MALSSLNVRELKNLCAASQRESTSWKTVNAIVLFLRLKCHLLGLTFMAQKGSLVKSIFLTELTIIKTKCYSVQGTLQL